MALLNLAVNARDAMPGGGTLRITLAAEHLAEGRLIGSHGALLPAGRYVRLSVADTGSGMHAETLARAVEPFFSTKGIGKGTGLGLSMVHGTASQMGGALTISSEPGVGTRVDLLLPCGTTAVEAATPGEVRQADGIRSGRALLVDDEDLVRHSTADMLVDLGYDVIEASSAEEAMRILNDGATFDLLVTDHLMPRMTGTELAALVAARRPGMAILLVSGYAETEGVASDLTRLTKPFLRRTGEKPVVLVRGSGRRHGRLAERQS